MLPFLRSLLNPFIGEAPITFSPSSTPRSGRSGSPVDDLFLEDDNNDGPYKPDIYDVLAAKSIINQASGSRLPIDLVDEIIDHALYWPRVAAATSQSRIARGRSADSDILLLRTKPLCTLGSVSHGRRPLHGMPEPHLQYPTRQIVFTLRSRDQGWSGEVAETKGTYSPSYTWFDAEIQRFRPTKGSETIKSPSSADFLRSWKDYPHVVNGQENADVFAIPSDYAFIDFAAFPKAEDKEKYRVQYNVQAQREVKEHRIVWDWRDDVQPDTPAADELRRMGRGGASGDGKFVRTLMLGDFVELWARARYPGWENHVESAQVEIFFAV